MGGTALSGAVPSLYLPTANVIVPGAIFLCEGDSFGRRSPQSRRRYVTGYR